MSDILPTADPGTTTAKWTQEQQLESEPKNNRKRVKMPYKNLK